MSEVWDELAQAWVEAQEAAPPTGSFHRMSIEEAEAELAAQDQKEDAMGGQGSGRKAKPDPVGVDPETAEQIVARRARDRKLAAQKRREKQASTVVAAMAPATAGKTADDFAKEMQRWRDLYEKAIAEGSREVPNLKAARDLVVEEAKLSGFDEKSIIDRRSEADKQLDAVHAIINGGTDILEDYEKKADALEKLFDSIDTMSIDHFDTKVIESQKIQYELEKAKKLGKRWRNLILRIKALQVRAREKVPPKSKRGMYHCYAAVQLLRMMAWTMRSNLSDRMKIGGNATLLDFRRHHIKSAWMLYLSENALFIGPQGLYRCEPFTGTILVYPTGMGKTTVATGWCARRIAENPDSKGLLGHAQEDQAKKNLAYLVSFFNVDNPLGRRFAALYGRFTIATQNSNQFRLVTKERSRQPTVEAYSAAARFGGADADWAWMDDMVDRAEREQPEERRRKFEAIQGQWMRRLRGTNTFHVTTATLWHHEDAVARRIALVKGGKARVGVLILSCGGPEPSALKGRFESLWPEVMTSKMLEEAYHADPPLYAAIFMSDPRPPEQQIIRKLRYYDPSAQEHIEFMNGAQCYLSLDPAATARKGSDKSGMVYGALGDVVGDKDGEMITERRFRVVDAKEILATMADLKTHVTGYCLQRSVHYVAIETTGIGVVMPDMLRNQFGIEVIECPTKNKGKELRLRAVGILIDDTRPSRDFGGAVVEFPGVRMGGLETIRPDPNWGWFYNQFLEFNPDKAHVVDALTQIVAYLSRLGELQAGAGWVTQKVQSGAAAGGDPRIKNLIKKWRGEGRGKTVEEEDYAFMCPKEESQWN